MVHSSFSLSWVRDAAELWVFWYLPRAYHNRVHFEGREEIKHRQGSLFVRSVWQNLHIHWWSSVDYGGVPELGRYLCMMTFSCTGVCSTGQQWCISAECSFPDLETLQSGVSAVTLSYTAIRSWFLMSEDVAFLFLMEKRQEGMTWRTAAPSGTSSKYTPNVPACSKIWRQWYFPSDQKFLCYSVLRPISVGNSNILFWLVLFLMHLWTWRVGLAQNLLIVNGVDQK